MKSINYLTMKVASVLLLVMIIFNACEKKDELDRMYEGAKIVGVKVDGQLYLPTYTNTDVVVSVPAGRDLSKAKVQVLVANGDIQNFNNDQIMDVRKPIPLTLNGKDGENLDVVLKIQSPPSLSNFIIEGLTVPRSNIFFSSNSLIVQVPVGTNLTNLKVTMSFVNGVLQDFTNGTAADYTNLKTFKLLGVDETTVYNYDLIITSEQVGPASVRSMTINGIETDSVIVVTPSTLIPFVKGLTNFSNANVTIAAGFGNRVDPAFTGTNLNLLLGNSKVKITGTDGIEKEFTIGVPQLSLVPIFERSYASFGFPINDLTGVAISGNNIIVPNYSATAPTVVGPNYYNLAGVQQGVLNRTGTIVGNSIRKIATDSKGVILSVSLGLTTADQFIYKWDNVTSAPVAYITYSSASLGLGTTAFRAAGINISGNLDGNAIITVGRAQSTDVFVWTVTGGVLNPTPTKLNHPINAPGFYYSIEPMPIGTNGFIGTFTSAAFNGVLSLTNTLAEVSRVPSIQTTDAKTFRHNGRTYLAYTVFVANRGAFFRISDITDNQAASIQNPIMNVLMPSTQANGNLTMDADMAIINGKLHAVFVCTNIGMRFYKLEQ
ncbi:hypothetical protein PBAC_03600 [Pedobacter glucosidilyticus]|nr:hypothetical protein [Pedobacter glucosidilyticus]KHJ39374.1 hypothetical protein PBAC_03600 [Pedobacter glucosidilyticus]